LNYYVSHMTPISRARIHKGDCPHCREGQGQENQERTNSGVTGWFRPFASLAAAEAFMESEFPRFTDKGKCGHCKPMESEDELAGLRDFVARLGPGGSMTLRSGDRDVTASEIKVLEAEIAFLEKIIERARS
jgi:hypothetical protein